jgi:hypothetical protein
MATTENAGKEFALPTTPGQYQTYTGDDAAAGQEFTITVPDNKIWKLISMQFSLVTDANVANRNVHLEFTDGTNIFHRACANFGGSVYNHAASTTAKYTVATGVTINGVGSVVNIDVPPNLYLGPNWTIASSTTNKQATDNFGAPIILVEEWNR